MTHRPDVAGGHDLVARWCALAEQRLEYLTEMFESGRWRRFYSELAFLEDIKQAKVAVETWRSLSAPASAQSVSAVAPSLSSFQPKRTEDPRATNAEPVSSDDVSPTSETDIVALENALDVLQSSPDLSSIERRYPLLRNTL
jgi:hypothetical protein